METCAPSTQFDAPGGLPRQTRLDTQRRAFNIVAETSPTPSAQRVATPCDASPYGVSRPPVACRRQQGGRDSSLDAATPHTRGSDRVIGKKRSPRSRKRQGRRPENRIGTRENARSTPTLDKSSAIRRMRPHRRTAAKQNEGKDTELMLRVKLSL